MLFNTQDRTMNIKAQRMTQEDENLFSKLYNQHYSKIYLYVYSYIKDENIANDIVSDIFILACEKFDQIKLHPNQMGWLYLTAQNKIKEFFRRMDEIPVSLDEESNASELYCASSYNNSVYSMKEWEITLHNSLTADEYKRFLRYFVWGYSIQEIADLEGISCNYMSVRLTRLRQKLKEYL